MNKQETIKILTVIQAAYPNYKVQNKETTLELWNEMLFEYSYQQVSAALKAYITSDKSGFAPGIGQIISKVNMLTKPQELNEMEAWALVSKALRNGNYGAVEEFEKLPETVREAVGSPDNLRNWATSDYETIETVIQSNFIKTYRSVVERRSVVSSLPQELHEMIESVNPPKQSLQQSNTERITEVEPIKRESNPMPDELRQSFYDYKNNK